MATPNNYISGKWTKKQREKAEQLLITAFDETCSKC